MIALDSRVSDWTDQSLADRADTTRFYAPWCGHCQNLKPAYEKAASNLKGLANVAAVNCDDESNKPLCGSMGVKGFPTLKIVRPSAKGGRPAVEDYQGARSAKAIVDAVVDKIPNHVTRVTDKRLDKWLSEGNDTVKAILFSDKGTTSPLLRALAIDFLGAVNFAQIRDKEEKSVETFGVSEFPKLLILPGGDKEAIAYDGEFKKQPMADFIATLAPKKRDQPSEKPKPNGKASKDKAKDQKQQSKDSAAFSAVSESHASAEATEASSEASVAEPSRSSESDTPGSKGHATSAGKDKAAAIPTLETEASLRQSCLERDSRTCILVLLPTQENTGAATVALASLGDISHKHAQRKSRLFPFFAVPPANPVSDLLREVLELKGATETEIIAVNAKKMWWRPYPTTDFNKAAVESWIDAIRMGEGSKKKLPEQVIDNIPVQMDEPVTIEVQDAPDIHDEL